LLFLAVLGPGFITANVDNDPNGILTYSQSGAQFGYSLLWTIIPITLALIIVQEMCARMGVVTGKGLSDLIREEFGLRMTFIIMVLLVVVNFANVVTEFIGIAGALQRQLNIARRGGRTLNVHTPIDRTDALHQIISKYRASSQSVTARRNCRSSHSRLAAK